MVLCRRGRRGAADPLSDVQIYDDRGRAVQTIQDDGWGADELPGVTGAWGFVPAADDDHRRRWNVCPLLGAPYDEFDWDDPGASRPEDLLTTEPHVPPRPFAKAPAVVPRGARDDGPAADEPDQDQSPGGSTEETATTTAATAP